MATVDIPIPEKHSLGHYAKGGVKKIIASLLPVTATSMQRLNTCLGCKYYSENSNNADKGRKVCRLCDCPVADKVKVADVKSDEKCLAGFWNV